MVFPKSHHLGMCGCRILIGLLTFCVGGISVAQDAEPEPEPRPGQQPLVTPGGQATPALDALVEELRLRFPDRDTALRGSAEIVDRLLRWVESHAGEPAAREDVGRARRLAAEALVLAGDLIEARAVWGELARLGPLDDDRAFGLFSLGMDRFLRQKYLPRASSTPGRSLPGAVDYWAPLLERYPGSGWAREVERPLRYLSFRAGGEMLPDFAPQEFARQDFARQDFARAGGGETRSVTPESLRGQVVLLEFWRVAVAGERENTTLLATNLAKNLEAYPRLRGKVTWLGVNLDTDMELVARALPEWGISRLEHHDGLGFRTPLAEAFGIPRVPHRVVISPEGRVVYIGSDQDAYLAAGGQELKRVPEPSE